MGALATLDSRFYLEPVSGWGEGHSTILRGPGSAFCPDPTQPPNSRRESSGLDSPHLCLKFLPVTEMTFQQYIGVCDPWANLSDQGQAASQRAWARMEEAHPVSRRGGWSALRVAEVSIWTVPGGDKIHSQLTLVLLRLLRAGRLCFLQEALCQALLLPCPVQSQQAPGCGV